MAFKFSLLLWRFSNLQKGKRPARERPGGVLRTEANRRPLVKVARRQALVPQLSSMTLNASFGFAGLSFPFWDEPWLGLSSPGPCDLGLSPTSQPQFPGARLW